MSTRDQKCGGAFLTKLEASTAVQVKASRSLRSRAGDVDVDVDGRLDLSRESLSGVKIGSMERDDLSLDRCLRLIPMVRVEVERSKSPDRLDLMMLTDSSECAQSAQI